VSSVVVTDGAANETTAEVKNVLTTSACKSKRDDGIEVVLEIDSIDATLSSKKK
jgi:hypothetical protein